MLLQTPSNQTIVFRTHPHTREKVLTKVSYFWVVMENEKLMVGETEKWSQIGRGDKEKTTNWNHIIAQVFFTDLSSYVEKFSILFKCYTNEEAIDAWTVSIAQNSVIEM